ncbi:MAG: apolipoprotein N-acyltransferase [bacterium]
MRLPATFAFLPRYPRSLALLSGALLGLAFPPVDLFFLAWVGLIPLLEALRRDPQSAGGHCAAAGGVFHLGTLYWIGLNTGTHWSLAILSMLAVVAILSFAWSVAGWIFVRSVDLNRWTSWLWVPVSWTAWEGCLGHLGEIAFPWPLIAVTQNRFEPILQLMEFTGTWGVTFWVTILNVSLWQMFIVALKRDKLLITILLVILFLLPLGAQLHAHRYYRQEFPRIKVLVAQSAAEPYEKWERGGWSELEHYLALTDSANGLGIHLAVWPETAIPDYLLTLSPIRKTLNRYSTLHGIGIITGASEVREVFKELRPFNTAFLILPHQGIADRTSKRQLVPMGEHVPFQWIFPFLGKLNLGQAEFIPGPRLSLFTIPAGTDTIKTPVFICFESAFPQISREAVLKGANFLATISNDAWFGYSSEPSQITALSRFRSIETRRSMARASNCGTSFICDPLGRIIARTALFKPEWRAAEVPLVNITTFYTRYGDWLLFLCTFLYGIRLLLSGVKKEVPRNE